MVNQKDKDTLRFIWRSNRNENFQDIHLLRKVHSSCCCIRALFKTESDNIIKIASFNEEETTDNFHMDNYLDLFCTVHNP